MSRRKKLLFAAVATLTALGGLELGLWAIGVQPDYYHDDPYAGFASHISHFVPQPETGDGAWLSVAPAKSEVLNPQRFHPTKPDGTYRIVCLGGSTMYGRPFFDLTSIAGWTRELLSDIDSSRSWEVINAGAISYASYRALSLMEELAQYEPDLFIVCTGHNEFLERRTYDRLARQPRFMTNALARLHLTRTATAVRGVLSGLATDDGNLGREEKLGPDVNRIPLDAVGPEAYHRDEALSTDVVRHFQANLKNMVRVAQACGADILFVVPESNLADFSPFKSEHRSDLSDNQLAAWDQHMVSARKLADESRHEPALAELRRAEVIDSRYAALHYLKGRSLRDLGQYDDAGESLRRARDEDVCPLRATSSIVDSVRDVVASNDVMSVDFERLARQHSDHALPGSVMFHDHVHPTIEANRLIGRSIVRRLIDRGVVRPSLDWPEKVVSRAATAVEAKIDRTLFADQLRALTGALVWLDQRPLARIQAQQSLEYSGETAEALVALAETVFEQRAPKFALELYERAIPLDPDSPAAHYGLAICCMQLGRNERAIEELREVIEINPKVAQAHRYLGVLLAEQKQYQDADQHLAIAARVGPDAAGDARSRGYLLAQQGRPQEALSHYHQSLAADPQSTETLYFLASAFEELGNIDQARTYYTAVLKLYPEHVEARTALARLQP